MKVQSRKEAVVRELGKLGAWALVVPSADPHMSEYMAERWAVRRWVSGFGGSAGTAVILADGRAALWTDSRYFLEAEEICRQNGFELMKEGVPGTPSVGAWIRRCALDLPADSAPQEALVVADDQTISPAQLQQFEIPETQLVEGLFDRLWPDRPGIPREKIRLFDESRAGRSRAEKLSWLADACAAHGVDWILVSALDEVAWTLNLRGSDVPFNPVFYAFLAVRASNSDERAHLLYVDREKVPAEVEARLEAAGIEIRPYGAVYELGNGSYGKIWYAPAQVSAGLALGLSQNASGAKAAEVPTTLEKAKKTSAELESLRGCMVADGLALVRAFCDIEARCQAGPVLDEAAAAELLSAARAETAGYWGESFDAIVGFRGNGAIIHYRAKDSGSAALQGRGLLLIDSGGQYETGTTDITRTLILGEPEPEERRLYTLVLKGHIALAAARFPRGTTGSQLDVLARKPLWDSGLNYGHGTGHGVGFALNVHEGPARISPLPNTVALEPGMILSDEPGYYRAGGFGIRIENLVAVRESSMEGFLEFETLTLFPYEPKLVDLGMLTEEERAWIRVYQDRLRELLVPKLSATHAAWLESKLLEI